MNATVYIETSIVSYLTARMSQDPVAAGAILETNKWWDESRPKFRLFTSQIVLDEASQGDQNASMQRLKALVDIPLLVVDHRVVELTEFLLSHGALPAKARIDAAHLAVSAINAVEYLLTWNCRHLANATLRSRIDQACKDKGYSSPIICTPSELNEVKFS